MTPNIDVNMIGELSRVFMEKIADDPVFKSKLDTDMRNHMTCIIHDLIYLIFCENDPESKRNLKKHQSAMGMTKDDLERCTECMDLALQNMHVDKGERENVRRSIDSIEYELMESDNTENCDTIDVLNAYVQRIHDGTIDRKYMDTGYMLDLIALCSFNKRAQNSLGSLDIPN